MSEDFRVDPTRELTSLFEELEDLMKNGDVASVLSERGINASLALTAIDALRSYLLGNKLQAAEDFELVAEEIRARAGVPTTPANGQGGDA
jgi:hypothetical protein